MKKRNLLLLLSVLIIAAVSIAMLNSDMNQSGEEDRSLKIKFSHKFHSEQGVDCADCHTDAATSKLSSDKLFGNHASCQTCHEEQVNNDCKFCHVKPEFYEAFENPERELIFSHEKHLTMSDVGCITCHQNLEKVDYASLKNLPDMATCNTCHDNSKATNLCETCHTNFDSLLPNDHKTADFQKDHKNLVRVGKMDVSCATCHADQFCQQCHDGASLIKIGANGLMVNPSPRLTRRDSPKMLTMQMAHDLNYRFTHGIDAKAKSTDCYTCHQRETFCSECHQAGGNITQGSFKPKWHSEIGFTTFGVGSGGGKHADLARRDIENCAVCHDANGADATCVKCHFDNDGIRGTNPKTHQTGYMKDERGLWHDTNGATCYVCHTSPNANKDGIKNGGFCNYCHI